MHPVEIETALRGMVVLIDCREQDTIRLKRRILQMECETERVTLSFGDYSAKAPLPDGTWFDLSDTVSVERKMNLTELCGCYTHSRERFEREFERAKEKDAKIYLLIENASIKKAYRGEYRSQMNPKALIASMFAWLARYNCQLIMVEEEYSGKVIKEILMRELKERLTALEL